MQTSGCVNKSSSTSCVAKKGIEMNGKIPDSLRISNYYFKKSEPEMLQIKNPSMRCREISLSLF